MDDNKINFVNSSCEIEWVNDDGSLEIVINEGVKEIPSEAFSYDSRKISRVVLADSIEAIDDYAFNNCQSLKTIIASSHSKLKYIGSYAFKDCTNLTFVAFPDTVREVGKDIFCNCPKNLQYRLISTPTSRLQDPSGLNMLISLSNSETVDQQTLQALDSWRGTIGM